MNNSLPKSKLVPISEAAQVLGVSIDTIRRWDKKGLLHSARVGKNRYFSIFELEKIKFGKPLPISAASKYLGISQTTLRRLEEKGLIKPDRNEAGERTYDREVLEKFLNGEYFLRQKKIEQKILEPLKEHQTISDQPEIPKESPTHKVLNILQQETRQEVSKLLLFRKIFYISSFSLVGSSILLISLITILFLLFPAQTGNFFGYKAETEQVKSGQQPNLADRQVLGVKYIPPASGQVLGVMFKPFSQLSLQIVRQISPKTYQKIVPQRKIADINDVFTVDEKGNLKPLVDIKLPDPSYLVVEGKNGKEVQLVQKIVEQSASNTLQLPDCSSSQILSWDGSDWVCVNQSGLIKSINSLTGGLTISGAGINSVSSSGTTITITGSETDTLSSVVGRGATTTTAVTFGQVDTTGNVGLGKSLTVTSTGVFSAGIKVSGHADLNTLTISGNIGIGGSLTGFGNFSGLNVSGNTTVAALTATGNVGVGSSLTVTSAPIFSLLGQGVVQSNSLGGLSSGAVNLGSSTFVSGILGATNGGTGQSSWTTGDILYASGTNTLSKLGIGSANQILQVSSGLPSWATVSSSQWTTSAPNIYFLGTTGAGNVGVGNTYANYSKLQLTGSGTGTGLTFQTLDSSGTQRFTILDNGNVGIGTTNPDYNFRVQGTGFFSGFVGIGSSLNVTGNVGVGSSLISTGLEFASGGLRVNGLSDLTGNVGIGGTATYNSLIQGLSGLTVSGSSVLQALSATNINSTTLTTTGNVGVGASITVSSASVLDSLSVTKSISGATLGISGTSALTGNVGVGSSLTVTSAGVFSSGIKVSGLSDLTTLGVSGAATFSSTGSFVSTLSLSDGTAATPGLNFSSDTDSGLWRIGSNQIALTTGGGSHTGLAINSNGNVGIGTTNPSSDQLAITSAGDTSLSINNNSSQSVINFNQAGSTKWQIYQNKNGSGADLGFYQNSSGLTKIQLANSGAINIGYIANRGYAFNVQSGGDIDLVGSGGNVGIGTPSPTDRLIVSGGNVGIGISTPISTLAVNGNSTIGWGIPGVTGPTNGLGVNGNVGIGVTTANSILSVAGSAHIGGIRQGIAAPSNGLFVDGNVGIGATTSSNILDVWGNSRIAGTLTVDSTSTFGGNFTLSSGQFLTLDGTATVPVYSFTNSTSTGIFSPSANALGFSTNGSSRLTVTAGGNIGIGFTSPSLNLSFGTSTSTLGIETQTTSNTAGGTLSFQSGTGNGTANGGVLNITSGNGGSGSSGAGTAGGAINITGGSAGGGNGSTGATGAGITLTAGTGAGVGNSTAGTGGSVTLISGAGGSAYSVGAASGDIILRVGQPSVNSGVNPGNILFQNTSSTGTVTERMRMDPGGNLGIGYNSIPNAKLAVNGNTGIGTSSPSQLFQVNLSTANPVVITSGGNLGIGFTTPTSLFQVNSGSTAFTVSSTGNVGVGSSLTVTSAPVFSLLGSGVVQSNSLGGLSSGAVNLASSTFISGILGATNGGTGQSSWTTGDILYASGTNTLSKLGIGSASQVLTVSSGLPSWATAASGSSQWTTSAPNIYFLGTTGAGNVGVGNTYANYSKLQLTGVGTGTGLTFQTLDSSGTQRFTILDNGNVGIGTTNPGGALVVSSGNVGIGFTSPDRKLQIALDLSPVNTIAGYLGANGSQLDITGSTASTLTKKLVLGLDTTNNIGFLQAGNNAGIGSTAVYNLILNPVGGSVGIGWSVPTSTLHVRTQASDQKGLIVRGNTGGTSAIQPNDSAISSSLKAWYKADAITGLNDGDAVSPWNDSSGNSYTLTESTNKPTYKTSIINGQPIVRFDGTNDILTSTAISNLISASAFTVFAVAKATSITGSDTAYYNNSTLFMDHQGYFGISYHNNPRVAVFNFDTGDDFATSNSITTGSFYVIRTRHAGGNLYMSVNGESETSTASGNTGTITGSFRVGRSPVAGTFLNGDVAEIIIYNTTLTAAQIAGVEKYLANKYALSVSAGAPTANLAEFQNDSGTLLSGIDPNGYLINLTSAGTPSTSPVTGSQAYDTTNNKICVYNAAWKCSAALSDYAEWAPAEPDVGIGDLVTITYKPNLINDPEDPFMLGKTRFPYDTKMIGVVSKYAEDANSANGYKKAEHYKAVALAGRVPVKVSTESGVIKKGDYLTSSSIPGVAMKATRAGSVVGKALEDFPANTSEVKKCDYTSEVKCGQMLAFIQPAFADPQNILNNLNFDTQGRLTVSEIVTKGVTIVDKSQGLDVGGFEIATNSASVKLSDLLDLKDKIASISAQLDLLEKKQKNIFEAMVEFLGNIIFHGNVTFLGRPTFNKDTAGFAIIQKGADRVEVAFDQEYQTTPLVNTSITLDDLKEEASQSAMERQILDGDIKFIVTKRNTKGFNIKLNKSAPVDLKFSWSALAVKDMKTFTSEKKSSNTSEVVLGLQTASASAIPTPTPIPSPIASASAQVNPLTIKINNNELGFLRVREEAGVSSAEVGQVLPGVTYQILVEKDGWYKIEYKTDYYGWVSGSYVTVIQ